MKKISILLVLFITLNGSLLISTVESQQSCPNLLFRLTPCVGELFGFVGLKRPIGYYCCNTIVGVSNYCPKLLWPWWLVESEKSCIANRAIPPPSSPTPPSNKGGDIATPPPYRNNENCPDISRLYVPCHEQIDAYYDHKIPINASCCSLIIEVHDKCSPRDWSDMANQCYDFCINHQGSTTTPSPTPPSNKGGDIATPPPYRNNENCPDISRLYVPCHEQIDAYYDHKIPINASCCSLIIEVHDKCSPRDWSDMANQCYDFCINHQGSTTTPSPTPPSNKGGDIATPPPYRNNENCPDISRLYVPCHEQIDAYYDHKIPINASCCSLIIEVHDKCSPRDWSDMANQCYDFCINHQGSTTTPSPTPPSNKGGDIATPPPYRNNENCPDISRLYVPCHEQIDAYYDHKIPINASCCSLIIEVHDKCSPRDWSDMANQCYDFCINHQGSTTTPPSPTPPSNKGGDIATPPPSPPTLPPKVSETQPPPPSPPILPPKGSETPPPPYRNNESCPDISRLYVPCHEEIDGYYYHKIPISSSCCSLIIEVHDKCSPRNWSDTANQCYDFCINRH